MNGVVVSLEVVQKGVEKRNSSKMVLFEMGVLLNRASSLKTTIAERSTSQIKLKCQDWFKSPIKPKRVEVALQS